MLTPESMLWLKEYVGSVNSQLEELFPGQRSTTLERAAADALSGGGKRVRAALALLWCEVFSGDYRPAVPLAAAYELAHASALVQDDIIDHSDLRRGKESIVAKYGLSNAILASDLLLFNVPKMVAKYGNLESGRLARIFDLVGEACRATTWGEFLDLEMARGKEGTEQDYEEMIRMKTSTLLSAPCASGAIVGGASDEQASLAGRFGESLGIAYQVQDDTLDLVGDEAALGKPVFTDLRGGKKSIVLLHCMGHSSSDERSFVLGLLNRSGPYGSDEISKLRGLIEEHGSLDYAREVVLRHSNKAKGVLDSVPECRAKSLLLELTDYLATRYY
ncbi:MAG TPA: polyprenyl synthetase family protein [Nitrososphaerales archaeon]|nr:polyprenyl synthetase family protein [Nitrososphaerales archaeon]